MKSGDCLTDAKHTLKLLALLASGVLLALDSLQSPARAASTPDPSPAQLKRVDFNRDVRPVLSDKCIVCHGPDASNRNIKLRLDSEAAAVADLGRGRRAIVAGNPEQSEMVKRITSENEAMRMPPVYSNHRLTQAEINLLVDWIRQGAEWQQHWAFMTPVRPQLPAVKNASWPKNAVDRFVLERLEREGLQPSAEADRATLIRRVSFDLTGLPPTLQVIDAFLNDKSPNAYEKVVDRLLASSRYGERMAFRWLDAARYADTNGYQVDGDRSMWRWRDWVIEAFNQNMSYDRFIIEQLAGDLLPNATLDQRIATAFNRNHRINAEGGIVPEEYRVEYVVDRVDTTSTVLMGLTMACARCHDHKYDPLKQKEFYQLSAYFNNIPEDGRAMDWGNSAPWIFAPTREQQRHLDQINLEIAQAEKRFNAQIAGIASSQRRWEKTLAPGQQWFGDSHLLIRIPFDDGQAPVFNQSGKAYLDKVIRDAHGRVNDKKIDASSEKTTTKPEEIGFRDGAPAYIASPLGQAAQFDGKLYFDAGHRGDFRYKSTGFDYKEQFAISAWIYPESEQSGAIITKMSDSVAEQDNHLPRTNGWGLFFANGKINFNMVFSWNYDGFRAETEKALPIKQWHHVLLEFNGLNQYDDRVKIYVNGELQRLKVHQPHLYLFFGQADSPLRIGGGGGATMRFKGALDELRVYTALPDEDEIAALACANSLDRIAAIPERERTRGQMHKIRGAFLQKDAPQEARQSAQRLAGLKDEKKKLEMSFPTVMAMEELSQARPAFVLKRGAYDARGDIVERGVPAVLTPMPATFPKNRLGLAKWLVSTDHPLTARVATNQLWQMLMGTGLVKTAEDFGSQGEPPSHPELLDWLAVEFRDSGWDVKRLLKTVVMSATYRQSSRVTPQLLQRDPDNRLLARGPRLRLSAEMIRDQALFSSGLLVEKIGGPSVKPYQPDGLYKDMAFADKTDYVPDKGEGLWRRSLYTFWKRTVLSPTMQVFDASPREVCTVRYSNTNTPLQSLGLMNDVTYVEAARFLGQRMLRESGASPQERLTWAFRTVTSRLPNERELSALMRNFERQRDYFDRNAGEAAKLLGVGEKKTDAGINAIDLAAYSATASLIFNLDEVIMKQ